MPLHAHVLRQRDIHNLGYIRTVRLNNCDGRAFCVYPHFAACETGSYFARVRVGRVQQGHLRGRYITFMAAVFKRVYGPLYRAALQRPRNRPIYTP